MKKNKIYNINKAFLILLVLILTMALTACQTTDSQSESKQEPTTATEPAPKKDPVKAAAEKIKQELGDVKQLPATLQDAVDAVGKEANIYSNEESSDSYSEELAVFENTLMYGTSGHGSDVTEDGIDYSYTLNTLYFGSYTRNEDGNLKTIFTSARISIDIVSDDMEGARKALKNILNSSPYSDEAKQLYMDIVDGAAGYITVSDTIWEELAEVEQDVTIQCSEDNSFEIIVESDPPVDPDSLEIVETRDEQDLLLSRIAYYYDDQGNKLIDYEEHYTYYEDNRHEYTYTYYYYNTTQIRETYRTLVVYVSNENGGEVRNITLSRKEYYENGQLKIDYENYRDTAPGTYKSTHYYENGQIESEEYFDEEGFRIIASYLEDGRMIMWEKYDGDVLVDSNYPDLPDNITMPEVEEYPDGTRITRQFFPDGDLYRELRYKNDVLQEETQYYESGNKEFYKSYDKFSGVLNGAVYFYDDENEPIKEQINYGGIYYMSRIAYYTDGTLWIEESWYTETLLCRYDEYFSDGTNKTFIQYYEDGTLRNKTESYENGNLKYDYVLTETGFMCEDYYYDNGNLKSETRQFEGGSYRVDKFRENGTQYYMYFWYPEGWGYEEYYDENGNRTDYIELANPLH